tara:strand:+ start:4966 stop:5535 length:570 start_codon:yes stop_codon:yes gene_type:complete
MTTSVEEKLDKVYEAKVHGHAIDTRLAVQIFIKKEHAVYGELLREGVEIIISKFPDRFTSGNVFYDIGAGQGKLISHIALKTDVSKSIGIELAEQRVKNANDIFSLVDFGARPPVMIHGDAFRHDFSDATVAYFDGTMFKTPESSRLVSRLPAGCLLITRGPNSFDPDGTFEAPTSYYPDGAKFKYKIL